MIRTLSLGAGVQSSVLALMAAVGEIDPFDAAIFADTQSEPASVYRWLDWLETQLPYPVHRVSIGSLEKRETKRIVSKKSGLTYMKASIPAFLDKGPGKKTGMLGRKCTMDFKIAPITVKLRELAGIKRRPKNESVVLIEQTIGISLDEYLRAKPSRHSWIRNVHPLIDMRMTREHCLLWMEAKGFPEPPRSSCRFCPFHSDAEWARLLNDEPDEFYKAAQFEYELQAAADGILDGKPYLHSSLQNIAFAPLENLPSHQQVNMFNNECEGLCGV